MDAKAFDWTLVRSFLAVIEAGSLMGAARRLGAHQPTLSRHVAELEQQLGVALFERTGRGVTPTAAALALLDMARQMQAGADGIARRLAGQRAQTHGSVRITASEFVATWLLPPVLVALQREEPGIQIDLVASDQQSNLLRREADIAVRMVRPEQISLVRRKLGDLRIVAAAHVSYLARHGEPRTAEDLLHHTLIGADQDPRIVRGFARLGRTVTREQFALRSDSNVVYLQLLAAGGGIGFVAAPCLDLWPGLRQVLPELRIPPLPCWLAVHREIRGNGVVRRVFDHLAASLPGQLERQP